MKTTPNILAPVSLALAAALFAATLPFTHIFALALVHAFAEAAMIGGLADWFAVVALFRHPMGLPIPHTAILPKHRAKLTAGIVDVLEHNWLNKESILARIAEWRLVPAALEYFSLASNRKPALSALHSMLAGAVREEDAPGLAAKLGGILKQELTEDRMVRAVQRAGEYASASGFLDQLLPPVFERGKEWCATPEAHTLVNDLVRQAVKSYAAAPVKQLGISLLEMVKVIDYAKMTDAILASITTELDAARTDEEHPLRNGIAQSLERYLATAHENAELRAGLTRIRESLAGDAGAPAWLEDLVRDAIAALQRSAAAGSSAALDYLDRLLDTAIAHFRANPQAVATADGWVKARIGEIVESYHSEIGRLVRDNLDRLDDEAMVRQIEEKVGGDLQYIRLNGAIVGGSVGALIYLLKHLLAYV